MTSVEPINNIIINNESEISQVTTTTGIYVTVHGHFYQPPRENPYLDAIERQPSASPFHNWNERIHHECYRPNAFARVLNEYGSVMGIVNNYEYMSFNIGPTLMTWLERYDPEVYQKIIEADRHSCQRLAGHGNAIAQVYNHIILPLANEKDKRTQIKWGITDFIHRFGRYPEGMWLAETAIDYPSIAALIEYGIKFTILAPSQAEKCRPLPTIDNPNPDWIEVGGNQIDPTRPYRCYLKPDNPNSPYIDIFFYDGPISRDMGFSEVLFNSDHLAKRIGQAIRGDHRTSQLISLATDGETFGHHKGGTEKTIAYAFTNLFPNNGWIVTNYAHYLSLNPPTWEVELKPVTAWSCSHGVDRWQDDCGCGGGGLWHQKWRRPLRDSLDWLRDQIIPIYQDLGNKLFLDPWEARDEYIKVVLDRSSANVANFLERHQKHKLTASEQVDALRILEMQRHCLLMYTSCGWFFDEISRPEGVQILRYASRAIELVEQISGVQLERELIKRLSIGPSNVEQFKDGGGVYRQLVNTAQVTFQQVAAHYAISSLFTTYPKEHQIYCYTAHQVDYQLNRIGSITLALGQIRLVSNITWESEHLVICVLHLGGWDFHCCIQPYIGRTVYAQIKEELSSALDKASAANVILAMTKLFGKQSFTLQDLFPQERHRIMQMLSQETLTRLDQLYTQVYRDNYGVLLAFHRDDLPVPQELQVAAEIAISNRALIALRNLEQELSRESLDSPELGNSQLIELEAIASEANHLHCQLKVPSAKTTLEQLILDSLWHLLHNLEVDPIEPQIQRIRRMIDIGDQFQIGLSLACGQELYLRVFPTTILPLCLAVIQHPPSGNGLINKVRQILRLGQKLSIDLNSWIEQLDLVKNKALS